jgi:hypothetical protein
VPRHLERNFPDGFLPLIGSQDQQRSVLYVTRTRGRGECFSVLILRLVCVEGCFKTYWQPLEHVILLRIAGSSIIYLNGTVEMKRTASMFLFVMAFSSCVMPQAVSC